MILGASSAFASDVDGRALLAGLSEDERQKFGRLLDDGCRVFSPERFAQFMQMLVAHRGGIQKAARLRQAFLADCTVVEGDDGETAYLLGPGANHVADLLATELQRKSDELAAQLDNELAAAFTLTPATVLSVSLHDAASAREIEFLVRWQAVAERARSYFVDEWGALVVPWGLDAGAPELVRLLRSVELFRCRLVRAENAARALLDDAWGRETPADASAPSRVARFARADEASLAFAELPTGMIEAHDASVPEEGVGCRDGADPSWIAQAARIGRIFTDALEDQFGHLHVTSLVGAYWPVKPMASADADAVERALRLTEELTQGEGAGHRSPMLFGTHAGTIVQGTVVVPSAFLDGSGAVYACPMRENGSFYLRCRSTSQHFAHIAELMQRESSMDGETEALSSIEDEEMENELDALLRTERVPVVLAALALSGGLMASVDFACGDELTIVGCGDFFEIWRSVDYHPEPFDPSEVYFGAQNIGVAENGSRQPRCIRNRFALLVL